MIFCVSHWSRSGLKVDLTALSSVVDCFAPGVALGKAGRPLFPPETLVLTLALKQLHNLSDEKVEFQLLDPLSFQSACGLAMTTIIPNLTATRYFEDRIGAIEVRIYFEGLHCKFLDQGCLARGCQIIDPMPSAAPKQRVSREERDSLVKGAMPADWGAARTRQRDKDRTFT